MMTTQVVLSTIGFTRQPAAARHMELEELEKLEIESNPANPAL
jgi:hypothetical protein